MQRKDKGREIETDPGVIESAGYGGFGSTPFDYWNYSRIFPQLHESYNSLSHLASLSWISVNYN